VSDPSWEEYHLDEVPYPDEAGDDPDDDDDDDDGLG